MNQLNSQMQGNGHKPPEAWQDVPEGTIDVRGYLDALHRSRGLIASIVVGFTLAVVVISFLLPKTYEATATIVMEAPIDSSATLDATSASRELTTIGGFLDGSRAAEHGCTACPWRNRDRAEEQRPCERELGRQPGERNRAELRS